MTELQRSILIISIALVVLLCALILRTADNLAEKVRVPKTELRFQASRACDNARTLATEFPERATGTEGAGAAAEWLATEMTGLGLQTEQQEFSAWIAGKRATGRNVIGIDKGKRAETIVLIAHYDIPFHVREGAMDDASGVGVLLELARVFSRENQLKTLVFIASDAEEWGMLGARHYVEEHPAREKIRAALSLDYVRVENPERIYIRGEGQFRGQTPLWLWMLTEDCISRAGGEPKSPAPLDQYLARAVNISSTDQGPFLAAGVPAVNLGGNKSDSPLAREIYHTPHDTSENLKPELFETYGKAVELMVRTLDYLDYSTDKNQFYFRTVKRTYLGPYGLRALQFLLFVPLLMATSFQYYNLRTRERFMRDVFAELGNITLFMLPWVAALMMLYVLVWNNAIPRYELYPATPRDPFLMTPIWNSIAAIGAVFVAAWAAVALVRRHVSPLKATDFATSKAVCLDVLFTLSIIALFLNGFAASLFLAPAALLWGLIEVDPGWPRRAGNVVLTFAAAAPLAFLVYAFSDRLGLGPYVGWYLLLGAGYGLFSPIAVLIAVAVGTVGGRLLQKSLTSRTAVAGAETENA